MNLLMTIFIIISFLGGVYYCMATKSNTLLEGMNTLSNSRCPDVLIQKGKNYFLYNSKVAQVPGVNPVEFENLEDYVEFMDWQRSQNIRCPVLFLQHSYDAQGESAYKIRPSPTDLQGGLPPNIPSQSLPSIPNTQLLNEITGQSSSSSQIGTDSNPQENLLFSPNPMDDNWGGQKYTQSLVDAGYYVGDEVSIAVA
jgi:hypothetical protein